MSGLNEIYDSMQNPMKNPKIVKQLIDAYQKSQRTDLIGGGIYNSIVKLNERQDRSSINLEDRERFYVDAYNEWIKNISNLSEEQLKKLEQGSIPDIRKVQDYLKSVGKVNSMQDIEKLKDNELFDKEINGWELEDGWTHIKSQYLSGRQETKIDVKHRLYVGCENQDIWKISNEFKKKCQEKVIPYYFKSGQSSTRDDKIVIYSDTQNLSNYVDILQEIAKENPKIMERMGQPPALTGKIDDWIGIGDEPPKKANGKNQSYNELRAHLIEDSVEETLLKDIKDHKGQTVEYNGKQTKFNDIFIDKATDYLMSNIEKESQRSRITSKFNSYGITDKEVGSDILRQHIKQNLRKSINQGLKKLDEVKDKKDTLMKANSDAIFAIPTRNGKGIEVNTTDMDGIIKQMIPVMEQIDPQFVEKVSNTIGEYAQRAGLDPQTFCFSEQTKQKFQQIGIDEKQSIQNEAEIKQTIKQVNQRTTKANPNSNMKFLKGFIRAYDTTEEQYQYDTRVQDEQFNIDRVQRIIETNGMDKMITSDLDGKWMGTPSEPNFKVQYSQKQVSAMARLLKSAELLTNNKKLNPEGRNYLEEFSKIPDIEYKLQQMRADLKDENTYMYELKEKAKENRANGNIPQYPETDAEKDARNSKSSRKQGIRQEIGLSQAEQEKIQRDKEARQREEDRKQQEKDFQEQKNQKLEQKQNYEKKRNAFGEIANRAAQPKKGKLNVNSFRDVIKKSKITRSETEEQTQSMVEINRVNAFSRLQERGKKLTNEQQNLVNEHTRRVNKAQAEYKVKQESLIRQVRNNGMGMQR